MSEQSSESKHPFGDGWKTIYRPDPVTTSWEATINHLQSVVTVYHAPHLADSIRAIAKSEGLDIPE